MVVREIYYYFIVIKIKSIWGQKKVLSYIAVVLQFSFLCVLI